MLKLYRTAVVWNSLSGLSGVDPWNWVGTNQWPYCGVNWYLSNITAVTPLGIRNICSRLKCFAYKWRWYRRACAFFGNQRFGDLAPPAGVAEWVGFLCSGSLHYKHLYWSGRCSRNGSLCTVLVVIRIRDHTEFLVPRSPFPPSCCRIIFWHSNCHKTNEFLSCFTINSLQ